MTHRYQYPLLRMLTAALLIGIAVSVIACTPDDDDRPKVKFTVDKPTVAPGQAAILSWEAENTDELILEGPDIPPNTRSKSTKQSFIVHPNATSTYTIFAKGETGAVQASVTITVK